MYAAMIYLDAPVRARFWPRPRPACPQAAQRSLAQAAAAAQLSLSLVVLVGASALGTIALKLLPGGFDADPGRVAGRGGRALQHLTAWQQGLVKCERQYYDIVTQLFSSNHRLHSPQIRFTPVLDALKNDCGVLHVSIKRRRVLLS